MYDHVTIANAISRSARNLRVFGTTIFALEEMAVRIYGLDQTSSYANENYVTRLIGSQNLAVNRGQWGRKVTSAC